MLINDKKIQRFSFFSTNINGVSSLEFWIVLDVWFIFYCLWRYLLSCPLMFLIFVPLSGDQDNLCDNSVVALFDQKSGFHPSQYANLQWLLTYQYREARLTRIFISQTVVLELTTIADSVALTCCAVCCTILFEIERKSAYNNNDLRGHSGPFDDGLKTTASILSIIFGTWRIHLHLR